MPQSIGSERIWCTTSRPGRQLHYAVLAAATGAALLILNFSLEGHEWWPHSIAFVAGFVLLSTGLAAGLTSSTYTITVDATSRRVIVEGTNLIGSTHQTVTFSAIERAFLSQSKTRRERPASLHVVLELTSGKQCHLFRGSYDGTTNRAVAQQRLDRLKHVMAKT